MKASPVILRRRPTTVEAMKIEENNLYLVAAWCHGVIESGVGVWVPTDAGDKVLAHIGGWVIHGPAGFYPATTEAVQAGYEAIL